MSATATCSRPNSPPSHQVACAEQREAGGVAEREAFTDRQVDEEPGDPRPVGVFGDDGAEQQRQVQAGQAGQLGGDHDRGERGGGDEPEQRPAGPVHVSGLLEVQNSISDEEGFF